MSIPSNLIPVTLLQLPEDPAPSNLGWMMYVNNGNTYKVQVNSVLNISGVPTSRAIIAGAGLTGGGTLASDVTIAVAAGGIGATQLDNTGVTAGTYGDASNYAVISVDLNGRVVSALQLPLPSLANYVPSSRQINTGAGLQGGGNLTANLTISANLSNSNPLAVGTETSGVSTDISRADHVHPAINLTDINQTAGVLDPTRGGTGTALTAPAAGGVAYSDGQNILVSDAGTLGAPLLSGGSGEPYWATDVIGTVTSVSIVTANGLSGSVANPTTTPALTLSTTVTGLVKGNGTALSAAVSGVDYAPATSGAAILYGNGAGGFSNATIGTGLSFATGTLTNTAPDQIVSLTGAGTATVTGTYPNFTITATGGAGGGDVSGPASATDNAITRYDGTTGKLVQNSTVTLDDNGNIDQLNAVTFDTTPGTLPTAAGAMYWDTGNGTPSINLNNDVTLQLGQEIVTLVYNGTGVTIPNGSVVAVAGAQGQRPSVVLADADSEPTSASTLGIATQDIADGTEGFITSFGFVRGVDTSGYTAGAPIYLSQTAGQFTATRPLAPAHTVILGWVIKVNASSGEIFVHINNGWELEELHNVRITSPLGGNLLSYDQTNQYWKNIYLTDGTGISVTETTGGAVTVTNTAPDQTVVLTGAGTTAVTGTYPNFTITSNDQYVGTVTSVGGTGTVNGITLTGTVTSYGNLTLGGTLSGIGNSQLTNSTISGVSLGGNLFNLTAGTGVSFSSGTTYNGSAAITINATGAGDVVGPASATDNAITRYDGTTGKLLQNSSIFITDTGDLNITATGARITGDFSNATIANRVSFQSSTTNGATAVNALPNGTSRISTYQAYDNTDPTNSSYIGIVANGTSGITVLESSIRGTGTYLPMSFYTGGSERVRINPGGNVGIGTSSPTAKMTVNGILNFGNSSGVAMSISNDFGGNTLLTLAEGSSGLRVVNDMNSVEHLRINSAGNVGIGGSPSFKLDVIGSGQQTARVVTTDVTGSNVGRFLAQYVGGGGGTASQVELRAGSGYSYLVNPTNTPMLFGTNDIERLRISEAGAIGLPGTNYGTASTQAIVSNGSASAPTWQDVVTPTATQTLTNKTLTTPIISSISNTGTLTLPTSTDTLVGRATTDTLTNKTLTNPALIGTVTEDIFTITDAAGFQIDPANGAIQTITLGANRTPAATNFTNGKIVLLGINDGTAYTITWTTVAVTWVKAGGGASAPTLATTGFTWILLWEVGGVIYGCEVGKP